MGTKRLALLGREPVTLKYLCNLLKNIFEDIVEVIPYLVKDKLDTTIPVVITTTDAYYNDARILFPNSTIIAGEKVLTGFNLEKVIMLPPNKRVLVINMPQIAAVDTVNNLVELGITHLEYIPAIPGEPCPPDVDTAITTGLIHSVPPEITTKIDIGFRTFSIDAFNRLLRALDLGGHYLDKMSRQYKLPLALSNAKLVDNIEKVELFNKERELIIDKIPDAIMLASQDKTILFLNKEMEGIIGKTKEHIIGKTIQEIIYPISLGKDLMLKMDEGVNAKVILNNKEYLYSLTSMERGKNKSYIFTFKPANKVKKMQPTNGFNYKKYGHIAKYTFDDFWGNNKDVIDLKRQALLFAKNDMTIFISGESGTGKEILAQAIHNASKRFEAPFVAVNFAAIPENLVESELFGYEGGAFTGALKEGKPGFFEIANGGTLFIDEIGDMPLFLQTRLLRVLQEREVVRIGSPRILPIDIRIIAATNVDLNKYVLEGKFRRDLYFRLNVLSLNTIPLRFFKENINDILNNYLSLRYNFKIQLEKSVQSILQLYSWPGNVRELFNVADYMFYSCENVETISIKNIPKYIIQDIENDNIYKAAPDKESTPKNDIISKHELYKHILTILQNKDKNAAGRNSIRLSLKEKTIDIGEHYLKSILEEMKKENLIKSGTTRQGTKITEKGWLFLYKHKS